MPERLFILLACTLAMIAASGAGCTSATIGDVSYGNGTLTVPVTSTATPAGTFIQVTVYEIRDFRQLETKTVQQPVTLGAGETRVQVPLSLSPGQYKLYIYILTPGERQTATIRDIVV